MENDKGFLNFAVGPVMMAEEILEVGRKQIPYFRTDEFSSIMLENEKLLNEFLNTEKGSRVIFLTASGTAAMEATVMNIFNKEDKLLIINGGGFGERFKKICDIHELESEEIKLKHGEPLLRENLEKYNNKGFTGFLINVDETSTGVLYDMDLVSEFCKKNKLILIVDAISSFLADEYDMEKWGIDATILSSQKALALPPGLSFIIVNKKIQNRIYKNKVKSMYFDLENYLKNGLRGQTPFTPAVGILLQLNKRLKLIKEQGIGNIIKNTYNIATDFRNRIKDLPLEITSKSLSNAVTPIHPTGNIKPKEIFDILQDNYRIFACPNGGELGEKIFRIGHIGDITKEDNKILVEALSEILKKGDI